MEELTFSILDILLGTGLLLILVRVFKNGILKELVFTSFLLFFMYITLNNIEEVYEYFLELGFNFGKELSNIVVLLIALAGLPLLNFASGLYVPKFEGKINILGGILVALVRYLLLLFFITEIFPTLIENSLVYDSLIVNIMLSYFSDIFIYLLY
ncbi:MAG: hypothetical protein CMD89_04025 [Gammaproteobacteria bacterium]|nr:hypothetical protein [Gammaproteobacteria bacterium]|tara:strand:+ start:12826 stop:13290 length:465 start_codon:yes stop_codon:yes gene_type:complete